MRKEPTLRWTVRSEARVMAGVLETTFTSKPFLAWDSADVFIIKCLRFCSMIFCLFAVFGHKCVPVGETGRTGEIPLQRNHCWA